MKGGRSQEPPVLVDFAAENAFLSYQSFREVHTKFIVWCVVCSSRSAWVLGLSRDNLSVQEWLHARWWFVVRLFRFPLFQVVV